MARKNACKLLMIGTALAIVPLGSTAVAAENYSFDLPAQPLADSIRSVARSTRTSILFNPASVKGRRAQPLKGRMTATEAVSRLSDGTGMSVRAIKDRSLFLSQLSDPQQQPGQGQVTAKPVAVADNAPEPRTQIEDIVVTAQRTEQRLQKVPIAVTAVSGTMLAARGITTIGDLGTTAPGLQIGKASGVVQPFLRGVGASGSTIGIESSVAVYTDGVYFSRLPVGIFSLANIERVEVLKGPQGTLFGRNSSGGVIQIVTKDPSHEGAVKGTLGYGRFDTIEGNLYATIGLSETVAADISISGRKQKNGWGRSTVTGNRAGFEDSFTARSKWLFEPSDGTRFLLSGFYTYSKHGLQGNPFPGTVQGFASAPFVRQFPVGYYDIQTDLDPYAAANAWGVSLKAEHELPFARLVSITAYIRDRENLKFDSDGTPRPDQRVDLKAYVKQFTQEFQIGSLGGEDLTWLAGLFYYNTISGYSESLFRSPSNAVTAIGPIGLNNPSRQKALSYAAYAQASYEMLPALKLTGGIRYTEDKASADGISFRPTSPPLLVADPLPNSTKTQKVTFRAAVDYQVTDDVLAYASFSRGFKSSAFNLLTYNRTPVKPETLDAYEVGLKTDLFDRRLRLNMSGFYYDIGSPQVQLIANNSVFFSNAGSARVKGAEIEAQAALADGLTGRFSATFLDSKYKVYPNAPSGPPNPNPPFGSIAPLQQLDARGKFTPQAPKLTLNAGFDYHLLTGNGDWYFTADYFYNDGFYWEPDNFLRQKAYHLVSGQIKYMPTENFGVRVWGRNLAGEKYAARGATQAGYVGYVYIPAPPRSYGLAFDFSF